MLTRRRKTLWAALLLLLLALLGIHHWFATGTLRRSVLEAISKRYDGHIELDRVALRIGGGLVVKGLRLHESSDPSSKVVLEIPRLDLPGSFWDLLRGSFQPLEITVCKPTLYLRQGPEGQWLSRIPLRLHAGGPEAFVPVHIQDAQLELLSFDTEDEEPRRLSGIQLDFEDQSASPGIRIIGHVNDAIWSTWRLTGTFDALTKQLQLRSHTDSLKLQPDLAQWLGADFARHWESVQPLGQLAVDAQLSWDPNSDGEGVFQYQILLDPQSASIEIPTCSQKVRDITGRIEITPESIRVHGLVGQLGSGEIVAAGSVSREASPIFNLLIDVREFPLRGIMEGKLQEIGRVFDRVAGTLRLAGSTDPQTWSGSFDGTLRLAGSTTSDPIPLHMSVSDGSLQLSELQLSWAGGELTASARVPLHEESMLDGTVRFEDLDLKTICELSGEEVSDVAGQVGGELSFSVPLRDWTDGHAWNWNGPVHLKKTRCGAVLLDSLDGVLRYRESRLKLESVIANVNSLTVRGDVTLDIEPPFSVVARFRVQPFDLASQAARPPAPADSGFLRGRLDATGTLKGTLKPPVLTLGGVAQVRQLGIGNCDLGDTAARFSLVGGGFEFQGAELKTLGGRIRLNGRLDLPASQFDPSGRIAESAPRAAGKPPHLTLQGDYADIDLATLLIQSTLADPGVRGRARGTLRADCPLDSTNQGLDLAGSIECDRLWVGNSPVGHTWADFRFQNGTLNVPRWSATLEAGQVGGSAKIDKLSSSPLLTAQVTAENLDLEKLAKLLDTNHPRGSVTGSASGQLNVQWDSSTGATQGRGTARLNSLGLNGLPTIDSVSTRQLEVDDSRITLRAFQATLWGGSAQGTATIDLSEAAVRPVDVVVERVDRVELVRIVAISPVARMSLKGRVSGAGKFYIPADSPDGAIFGSGEFDLESGVLFGLPVSRAQGAIEAWDGATHEWIGGRLQPRREATVKRSSDPKLFLKIREARPARGTVQGAILIGLNRPVTYDTNLQFSGLDLATVAQSVFASQYPVSGNLSGTMRLHGTERGVVDAQGEFLRLRVDNGNLVPLPVVGVILKETGRVLKSVFNRDQPDASQTAEARRVTLAGGTLNIEEFWLSGEVAKLFGQGTVTLDGQVNLEVVGHLQTSLPKKVPIVGTITKAFNDLQERLVKIHLTGTLSDPVAIPVPLQGLTEPAERFFKGVAGALFDDSDPNRRPMRR